MRILAFVLAGALFTLLGCNEPKPVPDPECVHEYGKWGQPKEYRPDGYRANYIIYKQFSSCDKCGHLRYREVSTK